MENRERCEACSAPLFEHESMKCNPCLAAMVRRTLASKRWREVRGPEAVATLEADLAAWELEDELLGQGNRWARR